MRLLRSMPPPLLVTSVPAGPVLKLGGFWPVRTRVLAASAGRGGVDPSGYLSPPKTIGWKGNRFKAHGAVSFPFLTHGCGALGITTSRCG